MRTRTPAVVLIGFLALGGRAADVANEALQKGLLEEEANRDLAAAIQAYQMAIDQFDDQRKVAATAVFRLAECYRTLGQTNKAGLQYERVVRDFADQTNLVTLSRKELDRMPQFRARQRDGQALGYDWFLGNTLMSNSSIGQGGSRATSEIPVGDDALARQRDLLKQELALVEQKLALAQKRVETGAVSDEELIPIQRDILSLKRQMAELEARRPGLLNLNMPPETIAPNESSVTDEEDKEIQRLKALKENSPDLLEAGDNAGRSPLHGAVVRGFQNAATYLLDQGANVDARDHDGNTPLHLAVSEGRKTIVELLLAQGAEVNASNGAGATPLHVAAARGFKVIAEILIAKGADVNAVCGQVRLQQPSKTPTLSSVFIESGTPLHNAVVNGFRSMVELLLAHQADINADDPDGGSPLVLAARAGRADMVKLLLERGADVNGKGDRGNTPLHWAIEKGSEEMVELLLTHKPQLELKNLQDLTPLQLAINAGQTKLALELLKAGANPNVRFEAKGVAPVTPFGRRNEPFPGGQNPLPGDGRTPLHWAVQWGFKPVVEGLLNANADINAKDDYGNTPLRLTVGQKSKEIMDLLLARGADVNARDKPGNTPLLHAVIFRDKEAVERLLAKGADVNLKNNDGQAPLDLVKPSPPGIVRMSSARSPGWAPEASPSEIAVILKKYGAKE